MTTAQSLAITSLTVLSLLHSCCYFYSVICARGKVARDHTGNRRFRLAIDMSLERYRKANSKLCRSLVVSDIVDSIRSASPNGGFVRCDEGQWIEVGDHIAREKVGQW